MADYDEEDDLYNGGRQYLEDDNDIQFQVGEDINMNLKTEDNYKGRDVKTRVALPSDM